jgi:type II secretory pathway component PulK
MKPQCRSAGFILIMVLVVIMLAAMVAASLLFVLSAEHTAAAASQGGEQAWAAAMSGVYQAIRLAADPATDPADLQDNPSLFRDQLVQDDGVQKWCFSVYSLPEASGGAIRFGLTDEASRLNLYRATPAMLETLPNLTAQLAEALLAALPGGATSSLADTNATPNSATNTPVAAVVTINPPTNSPSAIPANASSPIITTADFLLSLASPTNLPPPRWTCLDELLDVAGFTPALLYGSYSNLTGRVLAQTNPPDSAPFPDLPNAQPDIGLSQFLTLCSYDLNRDNDGNPRINLNQPDADLSAAGLPAATLAYLNALNTNGLQLTNTVDLLWATNTFKDTNGNSVALGSAITPAELPTLLDHCTTTNDTRLVGLVNLNTASAQVLAALPGMTPALAESVVATRAGLSPDAKKTTAWLLQDGIVTADVFRQVAPYLTTRGYQFHFFVAAYAVPTTNYRLVEAVVDVASQPPAILLLRDVTRLGLPFTPSASTQTDSTASLPPRASPSLNRSGLASRAEPAPAL